MGEDEVSRRADAEFSSDHLDVSLTVNVHTPSRVSVNDILDNTHNVLAGALASLGHSPQQVHTILSTWHAERAEETRQAGEF